MRKQLFVEGQEMDMMGNTYAMEWVSPLFQNLNDIKENRSTTIKLANTNHNLGILGNFNIINTVTNVPYSFIDAEYRVEGIPIISNAKMYILSVDSDSIDVCLLWDFDKLTVDVLKRKLSAIRKMTTIKYNDRITPGVLPNIIGLPIVQPNPDDYKAHNLFVKENELIDYIFNWELGLAFFNIEPQPNVGNMIELPTRRAGDIDVVMQGDFREYYGSVEPLYIIHSLSSTSSGSPQISIKPDSTVPIIVRYSGTYRFVITLTDDNDANAIEYISIKENRGGFSTEEYRGKDGICEIYLLNSVDLNTGNCYIQIRFKNDYIPVGNCTVEISQKTDVSVRIGEDYPIEVNLPDLTISEFLKDYFVRENKFLYFDKIQDGIGKVMCKPKIGDFKNVLTSDIIDWSDKLLTIENGSFKPENLAQKNVYKYKENEEVTYKADGNFLVNNEVLEKEKVIYESKFAPAPQNAEGTVIIPHFDEKGEYFDSENYYIVNTHTVNGKITASFSHGDNPLDFNSILSRNYIDYAQVFNNYKELTVKVLLDIVDILNLDLKKRYYFSQFSSNFLIKKCNIVDEIATLTIIKL